MPRQTLRGEIQKDGEARGEADLDWPGTRHTVSSRPNGMTLIAPWPPLGVFSLPGCGHDVQGFVGARTAIAGEASGNLLSCGWSTLVCSRCSQYRRKFEKVLATVATWLQPRYIRVSGFTVLATCRLQWLQEAWTRCPQVSPGINAVDDDRSMHNPTTDNHHFV